MTPGDHTARRLALQDARLVPLEWLTVVQVLDTECPPHPSGIVRLAQPTAPRVPPPPRVVRHQRMTTLGRAVWWVVERIPAAVVIALAFLLTYALIREMTP